MVEDRFMNYYELCDKYKFRPNYLNYLSVINVIKTTARYNLKIDSIKKGETKPSINFDSAIFDTYVGAKVDVSKSKSRLFYDLFIKSDFEPPSSTAKWVDILQKDVNKIFDSYVLAKKFNKRNETTRISVQGYTQYCSHKQNPFSLAITRPCSVK